MLNVVGYHIAGYQTVTTDKATATTIALVQLAAITLAKLYRGI